MSNTSVTPRFLHLQLGVRITMSTTLLLVHHSDPNSFASFCFECFRMDGMANRRFPKNSVLSTNNFQGELWQTNIWFRRPQGCQQIERKTIRPQL